MFGIKHRIGLTIKLSPEFLTKIKNGINEEELNILLEKKGNVGKYKEDTMTKILGTKYNQKLTGTKNII